jgi:two-component system, NtrC family, response regulator HydG
MSALNIFIVDDDQDFAESLAEVLTSAGHRVETCFDGETAIRTFREKEFDITFLDVKLPKKDGVESFFEIRRINPRARVVMMTAYSVKQLLAQAIDQGALGVLRKPFDMPGLLSMLEDVKPEGVILMADDDPDFVEIVREMLDANGYKVIVARTGQEALTTILSDGIDILILDLRLPVLSGLEVYLQLKRYNHALPTIIVTGFAVEEAEAVTALRSMSVAGFLTKPFDPKELLKILQAIKDEKLSSAWSATRTLKDG